MIRKLGICATTLLLLAGCGDRNIGRGYALHDGAPLLLRENQDASQQPVFSYTHRLNLAFAHGQVNPAFEKARDACLRDKKLNCDLITASEASGESGDEASLTAALPHEQAAAFEALLTGSGAKVLSRTVNAENVTTQAGDNAHKLAQLTAWRDRLAKLAARSDLSVTDLMKVQAELSKVEADLATAQAEQRDIAGRIAKEQVSVWFSERQSATAPITRVFANAGDTLVDSTASAIGFLISIVPWLPIVAAAVWLLRWLWFLARRK